VLWTIPRVPTRKVHFDHLENVRNPDLIRMSAFDCNDPSIIGYSVCRINNFVSIRAHVAEEDMKFYLSDQSIHTVWQYMPVDIDEVVLEIWKLHYHIGRDITLMVCLKPSYSATLTSSSLEQTSVIPL
jgi:hypothetical protein